MSDLMIRWAEKLLIVLVAVALVTLVFSAIGVMFMSPRGGFVAGLMTLVVGALSIIVGAGVAFVSFGIYRNGQETNRLLRDLVSRSGRPSA